MRDRRWDAGRSTVSPAALVNHLGLFVDRLGERFDGGHGVLRVEVVDRRFHDSWRHEDRILLTLPLYLRVLLVVLPDLIDLLGVLRDHDDSLIIEVVGC